MRSLQDEVLNQTFQLAYFIHPNRPAARQIAAQALESLETTTLTQDRRLYYTGQRTKVTFTELHLLQRLVYEKSIPYEHACENDSTCPPSAERLLVHFIKHLVWITARRNSLYVTLGLSRLLHCYSTAETLELYNLIIQNPNRVPAEDYCRNRKKKLMEEVLTRFGALLQTTQKSRGALHFVTHDQPARFVDLVDQCLAAFTPWQTGCHVPERFNATDTELPAFSFDGPDPDAEHAVEIKRYHALLHPKCLARLLNALGLAASTERLEIPRFYLAHASVKEDGDDDSSDEGVAGGGALTVGERDEMRAYLRDREDLRNGASGRALRFTANGAEVARLDLDYAETVSFRLPEYAEFLEIRTAHDDMLLATHRLRYDDNDQLKVQDCVIVLPKRRQLAFTIATPHALAEPLIEVRLRESNWLRRWLTGGAAAPASAFSAMTALSAVSLALTVTLGTLWYRERQTARRAQENLVRLEQEVEQQRNQLDQATRETLAKLEQAELARQTAEARAQTAEAQARQLTAQLRTNTAPPAQNIEYVALRLAEEKGADNPNPVPLPANASTFGLELEISSPLKYRFYTLEVLQADGQRVLVKTPPLKPSPKHSLHLRATFQRADFSNGTYRLRLLANGREQVGEYTVHLQFQ